MTYRVKFVSPSQKPSWAAVTHERNVEAKTINELIDKSLDQYDIEHGTRILEIYAYIKDEATWKKVW